MSTCVDQDWLDLHPEALGPGTAQKLTLGTLSLVMKVTLCLLTIDLVLLNFVFHELMHLFR
jgi:hypothetical protein